jgi:hypothetical protein
MMKWLEEIIEWNARQTGNAIGKVVALTKEPQVGKMKSIPEIQVEGIVELTMNLKECQGMTTFLNEIRVVIRHSLLKLSKSMRRI